MASRDSTATSWKVFEPPAWKPNASKSQEENISSFLLYFADVTQKMNNHLALMQQGTSKMERKMEQGELSNKRKREVGGDEREQKVIVFESNSDGDKVVIEEEGGTEEESESEEEVESDLNSDSETKTEEEVVPKSDASFESDNGSDFGNYSDDDDDNDSGSDSDFGKHYEDEGTSEDSDMYRRKSP
ncbi:uncharacterized protein LOC110737600 [Chenopodium quinoa]|uniref:uncharacterized protein LOC110737600 n=1 Tax=Chenopodium quinoa TaxID=63459 RepID=UPI000B79A631|nr:uncharacterized protein LOC110737600 [Chenopodium quinoa]